MQAHDEARKAEAQLDDAPDLAPPGPAPASAAETENGPPAAPAAAPAAPDSATAPSADSASAAPPPPPAQGGVARALRRALRDFTRRSDRFLDYLSVDPTRRRRASIVLAAAVNIILYTALAVFGRFEIWIPAAPRDSISVTLVELPAPTVFPELRDPVTAPEPEPEPEIVREPEIRPEPAPAPKPAPEPEARPEIAPAPEPEPETVAPPPPEPEPLPAPEPRIDLTPEPQFAPPAEDEVAPFVAKPEPAPSEEILLPEPEAPSPEAAPEPQAPTEDAPPLVEPVAPESEPAPGELEVTAAGEDARTDEDEDENAQAADAVSPQAPEAETRAAEIQPSGDDMFDEAPAFGRPRLPLPSVDLPEGQAATLPGQSGVVAIFCPEEFKDKDKAAECAGRTEIRSGWRPGVGREDWSEAIRLLKRDRAAGRAGTDPSAILGPKAGGAIKDAEAIGELKDFRRSVDAINDPAGGNSGNLNETFGRPDIGPPDYDPSWTLKEDPTVRQKDLKRLERDLEEAARARQPKSEDGANQ